jgi:hypothetical protein
MEIANKNASQYAEINEKLKIFWQDLCFLDRREIKRNDK